MKRLFDYLLFLLAAAALKVLACVPRPMAYRMIQDLAWLAYRVLPWHRNIILTNLAVAMPGLPAQNAKAIVASTYSNIGKVAYELSRMPRLRNKNLRELSDFLDVPQEVLTSIRRLVARGKGLLYLTGHFGVWELLPNLHALTFAQLPLSIVVRPLDNPPLDRLVDAYRGCLGNKLLPKKNSIKAILAALRQQEAVGILLDQNVCRQEGVFVDFFGKPACTNFGLAAVALRTDAPVLPIGLFYDAKAGVHRVHIEPEVPVVRTGNRAQDLRINTAAFTKALENMVRRYPDQWLWVHRRWKTRPTDEDQKVYL